MRQQVLGVLLAGLMASAAPGEARSQSPEDPAITAVIGGQISAFRADDLATAFGFASPTIKGMFGTAENFGMMVRQGYPMVWRPADVRYLELHDEPDGLWQRVMIRDTAGALHFLDYNMVAGPGGEWQINAVRLLSPPALGA